MGTAIVSISFTFAKRSSLFRQEQGNLNLIAGSHLWNLVFDCTRCEYDNEITTMGFLVAVQRRILSARYGIGQVVGGCKSRGGNIKSDDIEVRSRYPPRLRLFGSSKTNLIFLAFFSASLCLSPPLANAGSEIASRSSG